MFSSVEFKRLLSEWRTRFHRIQTILNPPSWQEEDWKRFAQGITVLVIDHGASWKVEENSYWDLRWKLQEGGELIAQVEHVAEDKTTLIIAQEGGFASETESYTWFWAEFDLEGHFSREPYWVEGTWKEALTTLLLPFHHQANFYLQGTTSTPPELMLQEGASPGSADQAQLPWNTAPEMS